MSVVGSRLCRMVDLDAAEHTTGELLAVASAALQAAYTRASGGIAPEADRSGEGELDPATVLAQVGALQVGGPVGRGRAHLERVVPGECGAQGRSQHLDVQQEQSAVVEPLPRFADHRCRPDRGTQRLFLGGADEPQADGVRRASTASSIAG